MDLDEQRRTPWRTVLPVLATTSIVNFSVIFAFDKNERIGLLVCISSQVQFSKEIDKVVVLYQEYISVCAVLLLLQLHALQGKLSSSDERETINLI